MALFAVVYTASLDRAADSISETVTVNAGLSVMTECNKDLHDQFGILAINNDISHLSRLAEYYISDSIDGIKRFVHLDLNAVMIDIKPSTNLYVADFKKEISQLGLKNIVFSKTKSKGLTNFEAANLPSHKYSSWDLLDPAKVVSALNLKKAVGEMLGITEYVKHVFTIEETEYLVFGGSTLQQNYTSTRNLIFAIRSLIDGIENIEDPIALAAAIFRAWKETDQIMNNREELQNYLNAMIRVIAGSNKLAFRIMDLMQMNVGGDFNFENYAYEFEIIAQYSRGSKHGIVTQTHSYVF